MLCCSFWYRHLFRNNASNSWFFKSSGYITSELKDKVGATFTVNTNPKELAATIIEDIEKKRVHFEALVEEKMAEKAEA
nr:hypothetical protein [Clostridioides difficile]